MKATIPQKVATIDTEPVLAAPKPAIPTVPALVLPPLAPLTEPQQQESDRGSAGQRRVNLLWESTQATMTVLIVAANVAAVFLDTVSKEAQLTLTNAMFVVLGFYYGRTNHQKIGGVDQGR